MTKSPIMSSYCWCSANSVRCKHVLAPVQHQFSAAQESPELLDGGEMSVGDGEKVFGRGVRERRKRQDRGRSRVGGGLDQWSSAPPDSALFWALWHDTETFYSIVGLPPLLGRRGQKSSSEKLLAVACISQGTTEAILVLHKSLHYGKNRYGLLWLENFCNPEHVFKKKFNCLKYSIHSTSTYSIASTLQGCGSS